MANYNTNTIRNGMKLMIDGDPYIVISNEMVKPGKGQAFNRIKMRNLKSGRVIEKTFKSSESIEGADVMDIDVQNLYFDGDKYHFMNPESFEQYEIGEQAVADSKVWLIENDVCQLTLWNGVPLAIMPPNFVTMRIAETDPGVKGDTAGTGGKPATLESGAVVRIPLFVQTGELIKVDTRTNEYVSRVKE